jgi:hypothetical protein
METQESHRSSSAACLLCYAMERCGTALSIQAHINISKSNLVALCMVNSTNSPQQDSSDQSHNVCHIVLTGLKGSRHRVLKLTAKSAVNIYQDVHCYV